jgi:uncharacterized protein (DUF1778 family)
MRLSMAEGARTERLGLRLTPAAKLLLREAASVAQRSISEFVLESALARTEETLADRRRFGLDAERWAAFMKALDAPPRPLPDLQRLLAEPSIFERKSVRFGSRVQPHGAE